MPTVPPALCTATLAMRSSESQRENFVLLKRLTDFEKYVAQTIIHGDAGNWTHKRKDGTNFTVNIRYHAIEYNGRRARFVIVTPATVVITS